MDHNNHQETPVLLIGWRRMRPRIDWGLRSTRRRVAQATWLACLLLLLPAHADEPQRAPITLIVPYAAGGSTDASARTLGKELGSYLKRTVVVEFVGGAGGILAVRRALHAPASRPTFVLASNSVLLHAPLAIPDAGYDWHDLVPVAPVSTSSLALLSRLDLGVESVDQLIDAIRNKPGSWTIGTMGKGSLHHVSAVSIIRRTSQQLMAVPYTKATSLVQDLVAGRIDLAVLALPAARMLAPHQAKILSVFSERRSRLLPDVPSITESLLARIPAVEPWQGVFAPVGTPEQDIAEMRRAVAHCLGLPRLRALHDTIGAPLALPEDVEGFSRVVAREAEALTPAMQ